MKVKHFFSIVLIFLFFSCKKDTPVNPTDKSVNLITNSGFETTSHNPDYSGWTGSVYFIDSLGKKKPPLLHDAPEDGGLWCVQLEPLWLPEEGFTETIVTGQEGTNIYKLSAWIKTINLTGTLSLEQWRNGNRIDFNNLSDTSSVWKQVSLTDTLVVISTDTIKIHLSAGSTEVANGKVRFDNIELVDISN